MRKTLKILALSAFSLGTLLVLISAFKTVEPLTKELAIKLAEQFVIDNGYTNFPADKSKLNHELLDVYRSNVDSILKRRHNTLQPKAFCICETKDSWDVGFLSISVNLNKLDSLQRQTNLSGRVVIVMKNGQEIRIAHKAPLFSHFKKLRRQKE